MADRSFASLGGSFFGSSGSEVNGLGLGFGGCVVVGRVLDSEEDGLEDGFGGGFRGVCGVVVGRVFDFEVDGVWAGFRGVCCVIVRLVFAICG